MQVMSSESLETLRRAVTNDPNITEEPFGDVAQSLNLHFVDSGLDVVPDFELHIPIGIAQEENMDEKNCLLISKSLGMLTPAQATDERLWATLCFQHFPKYVRTRWPLSRSKNSVNHANDHWFAKNNRNRIRDNAISRLWWMARIAAQVPNNTTESVLQTLFFNSDYRSSLLERASSANALNVVAAILHLSQTYFEDGVEYNRDNFRSFMKSVDMLGKRSSLASLDVEVLIEFLEPVYREAYGLSN